MPVGLLKDLLSTAPAGKPLMGLDVGSKTIGLSVSPGGCSFATPLLTIRRKKFSEDIVKLANAAKDYDIAGYVVGYPLNMDGSAGRACDVARSFADEMSKRADLFGSDPWVALWDERLSTDAVEGFVDKYVDIRKAKEKGVIDKMAAQIILQGALDYLADHNA